jgi:hypothetical protein
LRAAEEGASTVNKDEITAWALKNGWEMIDGHPSLPKPGRPKDAIVRLALKATVASLEIKKPSGKWEKVSGASYKDVAPDPETGTPRGLGLVSTTGISKLMRDNKDRQIFGKLG